jgi:hypothetical protein
MAEWAGMRGTSFAEFVLSRAGGYRIASEVMAMLARGEIGYSGIPVTVIRKLPGELPDILRHYLETRRSREHQKSAM